MDDEQQEVRAIVTTTDSSFSWSRLAVIQANSLSCPVALLPCCAVALLVRACARSTRQELQMAETRDRVRERPFLTNESNTHFFC